MNQEKIGKFIAENRKKKNLTQVELAEQLGVTDRSISKWENGRGMPYVSIFDDLCNILGISVNELLKGQYLSNENVEKVSSQNIIEYSNYLKKKEKNKIIRILAILFLIIITFLFMLLLAFNKTFFKTNYDLEFFENASIPIPRFSYYRGTGGMEGYTTKLKTLKQPDEVNILIDSYLNRLEKITCDEKIYYYNKIQDFTIMQYNINNDGIGFVNTIYIGYCDGKCCDK